MLYRHKRKPLTGLGISMQTAPPPNGTFVGHYDDAMGLKHHTILFVPHESARFRKWRVANWHVGLGIGVLAFLFVGSIVTTWLFVSARFDRSELSRVQAENESLRRSKGTLDASLTDLTQKIEAFEQRTRRLAIVAGLQAPAGAGVGGREASDDSSLGELAGRLDSLGGTLDIVESRLVDRQRQVSSTPSITPVRGILTSAYGVRRDPITGQFANHLALDIAASPGRPVMASADGIVTQSGHVAGGLGTAVYLSHGFGLATRYGHLSGVNVRVGQSVHRGDVIGYVGNSGRATGYHLHYEVWEDGRPVDPLNYVLDVQEARLDRELEASR
jgi:murein DD-endopeptidase MepM/ murein hydrolase activator NlpD